jgi:UDPglucose 6-dehydrogenase
MRVSVIGGAGYVGLVTAVGLAKLGNQVVGVDVNASVVAQLQSGASPIYEEGLNDALAGCIASGNLRFSQELGEETSEADVVFVAVGSPMRADGSADLAAVSDVVKSLAAHLNGYTVVAVKSTVPVGTIAAMRSEFETRGDSVIDLVVNPEFLSEGSGMWDFFHPWRIIVGTESGRARVVMRDLYAPFLAGGEGISTDLDVARNVPLLETSVQDAQIIKYASNAYLATRISFINEVAAICDHLDGDISRVVEGIGYDPRIGHRYLQAGIGFGGPCLEKDLQALIYFAAEHGYKANFLESALARNEEQLNVIVQRARELVGGELRGKKIAVLGLAFKGGTNDVRTSLSLRIIHLLMNFGAVVSAHDPVAMEEARRLAPEIEYADDPYSSAEGADLVLVLTDWPEYGELDWPRLAKASRGKSVFDGRNVVDRSACEAAGMAYVAIGR